MASDIGWGCAGERKLVRRKKEEEIRQKKEERKRRKKKEAGRWGRGKKKEVISGEKEERRWGCCTTAASIEEARLNDAYLKPLMDTLPTGVSVRFPYDLLGGGVAALFG